MLSKFGQYFVEVAKYGSIRRASEHLHISPSAVDRQILKMEERLGIKLFERSPQGLKLTAAGEFTLGSIRRIQHESRVLHSNIDDLLGLKRGTVSIATVEGALEVVADALAALNKSHPNITFSVNILASPAVVDMVRTGTADIGVAFPGEYQDLRVAQAMLYPFGLVVKPDDPVANLKEVSVVDCIDRPLVLPDGTMGLRKIIEDAWWLNAGTTPRIAAVASNISAMKAIVLRGLGSAILSPLEVAAELRDGKLVHIPLVGRGLPLANYSTITAARRSLSASALLLVQILARDMMTIMNTQASSAMGR